MATFGDEFYQSTRRKMNAQARTAMQTAAGDEQIEMIGVSSDGKQAVVLGSQRLISRDDEKALHELDLANLHSVVAMENRNAASGRSADYVLAALVPGEPFPQVFLRPNDALQLAQAARNRLTALRQRGDAWWDDPGGELAIRLRPTGMLVGPAACSIPNKTWCSVSFVNTGVQIQTAPEVSSYKPTAKARLFVPWDEIREVAPEGVNQVQLRPSVASVVAFGVFGLAARKKETRSYLTLSTEHGDYVFQVEGKLPAELAAELSPVLRGIEGPTSDAPNGGQSGSDPIERIRKLATLRDEGILTEDEFTAKKAELLKDV